jgi:hypothetical protein
MADRAPPRRRGLPSARVAASSPTSGEQDEQGSGARSYCPIHPRLIIGSAPPERAGAASAISETSSELSGAVAAGEQLPEPLAAELLEAASEAFIQGLQVATLTSALIALTAAVLTAILLRHVQAGQEGERTGPHEWGRLSAAQVRRDCRCRPVDFVARRSSYRVTIWRS